MNLTSPSQVRDLLARLDVRPNRVLGQNFLIDRNILDILVGAAAPSPQDTVLEVGPGLGVVTDALARRAGWVAAVEKDGRLAEHLRASLGACGNLLVVQADMLDVDVRPADGGALRAAPGADGRVRLVLPGAGYDLVSNLPYSSGSRIMVELARAPYPPRRMTVTVQNEVAARICAPPGGKAHGMLSAWLQYSYEPALVRKVSATCFYPRPEVGSAIVALRRRPAPLLDARLEPLFYDLTKHGFEHRRKQLAAILRQAPPPFAQPASATEAFLAARDLPPAARPEQLGVEDWCELVRTIAAR